MVPAGSFSAFLGKEKEDDPMDPVLSLAYAAAQRAQQSQPPGPQETGVVGGEDRLPFDLQDQPTAEVERRPLRQNMPPDIPARRSVPEDVVAGVDDDGRPLTPVSPRAGLMQPPAAQMSHDPAIDPERRVQYEADTDDGGRFDFSRAVYAFGGGNPTDIDAIRDAPLRRQKMQGEIDDAGQMRDLAKQAINVASPLSRQKQTEFASLMRTQAKMASAATGPVSTLAPYFNDLAERAPMMSAAQITSQMESQGKLMPQATQLFSAQSRAELGAQGKAMQERGVVAQEALAANTVSNTKTDNDLAREKFNYEKGQALAGKMNIRMTGDQHKVVGEMAADINQTRVIDELLPQAREYAGASEANVPGMGKSGVISGRVQTVKSMLNPTTDPKFNKFRSNTQRLFSVERKMFAGVAVTPQEMQNLAPMIPDFNRDSEATIRDKLETASEYLRTKTDTNMSRLLYDADGKPIDRSLLTKMLAESAPASVAANPSIIKQRDMKTPGQTPPAPPTGTPAGTKMRNKRTGEEWTWDGSKWGK